VGFFILEAGHPFMTPKQEISPKTWPKTGAKEKTTYPKSV
jgi:hypothetical protein